MAILKGAIIGLQSELSELKSELSELKKVANHNISQNTGIIF